MSETQRIQHKTRVGGPGTDEIVLVNGVKYALDATGCVDVPADAAKKLMAGEMWRAEGAWGAIRRAAADTVPEAQNGARPVRTPAQLAALAAATGEVEPKAPEAPEVPPAEEPEVPPAEEAPAEDEIVVSADMSRNELLSIAQRVGLALPSTATKAQILTALESASV